MLALSRHNLNEVSFIRPILIVLLVMYHAFAPWCGAWKVFDGFVANEVYCWIGKAAYSFMLPMFVFISGYIWAFQRELCNKKDSLRQLALKKFKRLYVPSILFSIAYLLLFDISTLNGGGKVILIKSIEVFSGYAHMWFLPMLFWVFIVSWLILQIKERWMRWILVIAISFLGILPIPFGVGSCCYYLIYFFAGYEILTMRERITQYLTIKMNIFTWIFFAVVFVTLTLLNEQLQEIYMDKSVIEKALGYTASNILTKIYGFLGIVALFSTSLYFCERHSLSDTVVKFGSYCMGIYLFQQFILQTLYYHTKFPVFVGNQLLIPWCGFVITLMLSFGLSVLARQSRVGKHLI